MTRCARPGCTREVRRKPGPGRPPKYCTPECASVASTRRARARERVLDPLEITIRRLEKFLRYWRSDDAEGAANREDIIQHIEQTIASLVERKKQRDEGRATESVEIPGTLSRPGDGGRTPLVCIECGKAMVGQAVRRMNDGIHLCETCRNRREDAARRAKESIPVTVT